MGMLCVEHSKGRTICRESTVKHYGIMRRNAAFMITKEVALPASLRGDRDD